MVFHALDLKQIILDAPFAISPSVTASLVLWITVFILFISCFFYRLHILGNLVFPLASISTFLTNFVSSPTVIQGFNTKTQAHIILTIISYGAFAVAGLLAACVWLLSATLKGRFSQHPVIRLTLQKLPSLDELEVFLFLLLSCAGGCLTVGLIYGWWSHTDLFSQQIIHKTILSVFAWLIFFILLLGHYCLGWRGGRVMQGILSGMALLILAYFGSKWISGILM